MSASHARPAPAGASLLSLSAVTRLASALAISALLWAAVIAVTR